jgi:small subunit ribosomal protein S18
MIQNYELYFILNPELKSEDIDNEVSNVSKFLSEILATDIVVDKQGVKKFAYPINKRMSGYYVLMTFNIDIENIFKLEDFNRVINLNLNIWRYLLLNITEDLKLKAKESLNKTEISTHLEYNSGKKKKKDFLNFLGYKYIDYKDSDLLSQFTSPYAKIFGRIRTGNNAKNQRKITRAIKRARHMGLLPFTALHNQG